jgi:rod shape-determining protein MreC
MENAQPVRFFKRGHSATTRFVLFLSLSVLLMGVDAHFRYLENVRYGLSVLVQPVQQLLVSPGDWLRQGREYLYTQSSLIRNSELLLRQHEQDKQGLLRLQSLEAENRQLRKLAELRQSVEYSSQLAEVVYQEKDVFRRRVFLDKGAQAGVQAGQVVMDDNGIAGQVTRVYPLLSEVTLITDKEQAVPVSVLRNGLRTVVFGAGNVSQLSVRYLPISSDIQKDDMLMTSGIDGVYPPGLPVARVIRVDRDPAYPFARILCDPVARVDQHKFLLILTGQPNLPPKPELEVEKAGKSRKKKP